MEFRGHLRLPDDAGDGIPVLLRVDDIFVVLTHESEELGAWRADDVSIERLFSNQFLMDLAGEPMVFIAADALGFAYEGVAAITELQERLGKRRLFKRSKKKDRDSSDAEPTVVPQQPTVTHRPQRSFPDVAPPPPSTPAFDEPAAASTETAPVDAPSPVAGDEPPVFEPPAREPEATPPPVWTPPSAPPAPPAAPPSDAPPVFEPPPPRPETAPAEPAAFTPEFEVEEVESTVGGYSQPVSVSDADDDAPVEIEVDEYVMPAAGLTDTYTPPPSDAPPAQPWTPPESRRPEPAPAPTPEPEVEQIAPAVPPPAAEPSPVDPVPVEPPPVEAAPMTPREEPVADEEVTVSPNGYHDEPAITIDETEEAEVRGRHEDDGPKRRRSLFGRSKEKEIPEHEHEFGPPKTIAGLTRAVCEICGHVTFSGEDVYQDW